MATKKKAVVKTVAKKGATKSPPAQLSKRDTLLALMGQLNKPDHKVIAFGDQVPNTYELRRPCGIMQLDIDTGGGLPSGGLCYLTGPDGAGKTHLLLRYMAMHQKIYKEDSCLALAAIEGGFDFKRALSVGMKLRVPKRMVEQWRDERSLRGMPDFTKEELEKFNEQYGDFVLLGGATGEEVLDAVLGCVKSKIFGIVGLDSINGLLPEANAAKELDEELKRAAHATLITKFLNQYIPHTCGLDGVNETSLIFVQQVRANADKATAPTYIQKYLPDWAATGAWAGRHFKLVDIVIDDGPPIKKDIGGEKVTVGKPMRWRTEKGKAGTHDNITGEVAYYYNGGIDLLDTVIVAGTKLGVIQETGAGVTIIRPETKEALTEEYLPSIKKLKEALVENFDFELAVRREVLAAVGVQCLYR